MLANSQIYLSYLLWELYAPKGVSFLPKVLLQFLQQSDPWVPNSHVSWDPGEAGACFGHRIPHASVCRVWSPYRDNFTLRIPEASNRKNQDHSESGGSGSYSAYAMSMLGLGTWQIAKRPEADQVLVPTKYMFCKFDRNHPWRNPDRPYAWNDGTVARILENEAYIGAQISC